MFWVFSSNEYILILDSMHILFEQLTRTFSLSWFAFIVHQYVILCENGFFWNVFENTNIPRVVIYWPLCIFRCFFFIFYYLSKTCRCLSLKQNSLFHRINGYINQKWSGVSLNYIGYIQWLSARKDGPHCTKFPQSRTFDWKCKGHSISRLNLITSIIISLTARSCR